MNKTLRPSDTNKPTKLKVGRYLVQKFAAGSRDRIDRRMTGVAAQSQPRLVSDLPSIVVEYI